MRYRSLVCDDEERLVRLQAHDRLHGIDRVEVDTDPPTGDQRLLRVYFISKTGEAGRESLSDLLHELEANPMEHISIGGGVRVRPIEVLSARRVDDHLEVRVKETGDFSAYTFAIDPHSVAVALEGTGMDPAYAERAFSFKANCPSDLDCAADDACPPETRTEPVVDYMAKDFASFRRALLDRISAIAPGWTDRHEADLGMALVDLLAYVGDHLSYYQDAVANEAYLETARQRVSVRRHARLIDYPMHDGTSARAFVHASVDVAGTLPAGTQVLSRIDESLDAAGGSLSAPHGPEFTGEWRDAALEAADVIFETLDETTLHPRLNEIHVHDWGNRQCCLPEGTTTVDFVGDLTAILHEGDYLLFEEVKGVATGLPQDADPDHRQIVRIARVVSAEDPLAYDPVTNAPPLPLTRVTWDEADALTFPLCISAKDRDGAFVSNVSVARGNLILSDHGQTLSETEVHAGPEEPPEGSRRLAHRIQLQEGPLSFRVPASVDGATRRPAVDLYAIDPRNARPEVRLEVVDGTTALSGWRPVPVAAGGRADLLDSRAFDRHFVVETDNDGRAFVRFGDDVYGMAPPDDSTIRVTYRVGLGTVGNVGADALAHVVNPGTHPGWPVLTQVRNPLPAWGGEDPEPLERVKQVAPAAMRGELLRAVTEADYAEVAGKHPEVAKAVATFRWTGSWLTVFLTVDPKGLNDLPRSLERRVRDWVTPRMQTGYDLEIDGPSYVPLEIHLHVCAEPGYFQEDVREAVREALSSSTTSTGEPGFFHPDNFTFGEALYLSDIHAAAAAVKGVESVEVRRVHRFGDRPGGEVEQGFFPVGRLEILRLDNDSSFPENGVLHLTVGGGM